FLFCRRRRQRFSIFRDLGIPGPTPSFLSGNLSELIRRGAADAFDEWTRKYGDLVGFYNGGTPILIIKNLDLIKSVQIKDFENFHERGVVSSFSKLHPLGKVSLNNTSGERWKQMRSLLTPAFRISSIKKMVALMDDCSNEFLGVLKQASVMGEAIEVQRMFQKLAIDVIVRSAFGICTGIQQSGGGTEMRQLLDETQKSVQQFRTGWLNFFISCFPELSLLWRCILVVRAHFMKLPTDNIRDGMLPIINIRRLSPHVSSPEIASMSSLMSMSLSSLSGPYRVVRWSRVHRQWVVTLPSSHCVPTSMDDLLQLMLDSEAEDGAPINVHELTAGYENEPASNGRFQARASGPKRRFLTNEEIQSNAIIFLIAGFETASTVMTFTAYLLGKHQQVQDRLRSEIASVWARDGKFTYDNVFAMRYLDQVISESIRFYTPFVGFITRTCQCDYDYNGLKIPAGLSILIPAFSRENKRTIHPMAFQPFGNGPRNCVGIRFAQLEMKLTLAKLLTKYNILLDQRHIKEEQLKLGSTFIFSYPQGGVWLKFEEV
ncbi:unnamed protein product, partial [Ixodes hexagonus]